MPDITKCLNKDCILKDKCLRFTSIPNDFWQSYSSFKGGENCKMFIDNKKEN